MKRTHFVLMAFLVLLATACDNDDDFGNPQTIQSLSFIPDYADGSLAVSADSTLNLKCIVSPASALKGLAKDNFKVLAYPVGTENARLYTLPASILEINDSLGMVKIESDISSVLAAEKNKGLAVALHVGSGTTDYTSSFVKATHVHAIPQVVPTPSRKQVDMTVVVPIHPSSLEYFDYIICSRDNQGIDQKDTIQASGGGIVVEDWVKSEKIPFGTRTALTSNDCYVRTFTYDNLSVSCVVTVEMVPKKDVSSLASFFFCTPKPYIFPNVRSSASPVTNDVLDHVVERAERIRIDSMTIRAFQSAYGTIFSSYCGVYASGDGYEIFFY